VSVLSSARKVAPIVRVFGQLTYYRIFKGGRTFSFQGSAYRYLYRQYNTTFVNERAIELPLAWDLVKRYPPERVLEIGNVLAHYYKPTRHDVLDKYEKAPGVINDDVVTFAPGKRYDLIVSVSTLEHVGWDEEPREPGKILRAIDNLTSLLAPGGQLFMTVPTNYNAELDGFLAEARIPFSSVGYAKRVTKDNQWREAGWSEVEHTPYIYFRRNRLGMGVSSTATGLVIGRIISA